MLLLRVCTIMIKYYYGEKYVPCQTCGAGDNAILIALPTPIPADSVSLGDHDASDIKKEESNPLHEASQGRAYPPVFERES